MEKLVKGLRVLFGFMWFLLGVVKVGAVLFNLVTGGSVIGTMFVETMQGLADHAFIPFYQEIANSYYVVYPVFFFMLAGLIELYAGFVLLKGGKMAKWAPLGFVWMTLIYCPFHTGGALVGNFVTIALYLWVMTKDYEDNVFANIKDRFQKK